MSSLRLHRVEFAFTDAVPLLSDVDFQLEPGWTGLVGENGAGKTTLLSLIAGDLTPDSGDIRVEPRGGRVVRCRQSVDHLEASVEAFGRREDGVALELRGRLDLDDAYLARWPTLSPGERRRWQIGAALAAEPDVLLLDEPTNHLDAPARRLLASALRQYGGIGVLVSHDRALLNELTRSTLRVHRGGVRLWRGAYDVARAGWEAERREELDTHHRLQAERRVAARQLDEARREHASAQAGTSTRRRMRDKNDSDARGMGAQTRAAWAEKRTGRNVTVARRELARADLSAAAVTVDKTLGRSVFVDWSPSPSPRLLTLDVPELCAGGRRLIGEIHLAVLRESRVRIAGPNGSGKTTLVEALLAGARVPRERILHVPQDPAPEEERALLESVRALPPELRGRVLSIVAALGVDPGRLLASRRPSPGEARKLMIALGLGRHVWAVVLDEPTNHLDLPSIERLEEALLGYPGALVLVTHDDRFARRLTTTSWSLDGGEVRVTEDSQSADRR